MFVCNVIHLTLIKDSNPIVATFFYHRLFFSYTSKKIVDFVPMYSKSQMFYALVCAYLKQIFLIL